MAQDTGKTTHETHLVHQAEPKAVHVTPAPATVRMKYTAHFKGNQKVVQLPIPLIANSQKLEQTLLFTRAADSHGPALCDVPIEWAGALLETGGYFQAVDKLTPELQGKIAEAKNVTAARMQTFAEQNQADEG